VIAERAGDDGEVEQGPALYDAGQPKVGHVLGNGETLFQERGAAAKVALQGGQCAESVQGPGRIERVALIPAAGQPRGQAGFRLPVQPQVDLDVAEGDEGPGPIRRPPDERSQRQRRPG